MAGYVLVTNPGSGSHDDDAVEVAHEMLARSRGVEVETTASEEDLAAVCSRLGGRTVVVAGGDGSLHAVVNVLNRTGQLGSTCLGLVPLGTGNDFARSAGIPLEPAAAAAVVVSTEPRPVDLVLDSTGTVAVNGVHLGVGADASEAGAAWKPRLGRLGYAVGALRAGLRPEFLRVRVEVDDRVVHDGRITQVAIGNGAYVGGGTELVPGADPASGALTVVVSEELGRRARLAYLARLRRGEHHEMREVTRVEGRSVTVSGEPFTTVTDGELSGPHTALTWSVLPGALRMHLP